MTVANPKYQDLRFNVDDNRWEQAKAIIGTQRVTLGPQASDQYLNAPEHLAMVGARYRAAAALIGDAQNVLEIGCGEGIGAKILARDREMYVGEDTDVDAIQVANETLAQRGRTDRRRMSFVVSDGCALEPTEARTFDAVVALDVIEHIPAECEIELLTNVRWLLTDNGVCVIGTPSASFDHLASPQSKAGHINLYTHDRLHALMRRYFHVVQMMGMQDTSVHFGHPEARHYLLFAGIGPRRG